MEPEGRFVKHRIRLHGVVLI